MPSKIIVRTPLCKPICKRSCGIEIGKLFVVDSKKWNNICDFFASHTFPKDNNKYWEFMFCSYYDASEFVKECEIIEKSPSKEIINFVDKLDDEDFIYNLEKLVEKYMESDDDDTFEKAIEKVMNSKEGTSQISKLLVQLRKGNKLKFTNDEIVLNNS